MVSYIPVTLTPVSASKNTISVSQNKNTTKIKFKAKKKLKQTKKISTVIESENPLSKQLIPSSSPSSSSSSSSSSPSKRNKSPGIRIIHGRIYDSEKGKTCHQCRQKTMDFAASCKILQCPFHYCHKCLLNRYGENAEEVAALIDWKCPKCRGICNCSFCMKKRGCKPTGSLIRTAKATGFSSVAELLRLNDSEKVMDTDVGGSPQKRAASDEEEPGEVLTQKHKKENGVDGKSCKPKAKRETKDAGVSKKKSIDPNKGSRMAFPKGREKGSGMDVKNNSKPQCDPKVNVKEKKSTKGNSKGKRKDEGIDDSSEGNHTSTEKKRRKRRCISKEVPTRKENTWKNDDAELQINMNSDSDEKLLLSIKIEENEENAVNRSAVEHKQVNEFQISKKEVEVPCKVSDVEIPLPQGAELKNVADIDLAAEDIGHALQFLEFCKAFGKEGQSESLLREITSGRGSHQARDSSIVQFLIKLLSMIRKDSTKEDSSLEMGGEDSWLQLLTSFFPKSEYMSKELDLGCINTGADGYQELNSSKRLRLMNFLCDEALGTSELRNWIDEQNLEFAEEEKKRVLIDKEREKNVKKSLQDEVARVVLVQNGTPLSISEHEDLLSKIKAEVAQTLAETQGATGTVLNKKQRSDAVRAEPILSDAKGRKFWKLRGYSGEMGILLQDFGSEDLVAFEERWFSYDVQEKANVEKYISSLRQLRK